MMKKVCSVVVTYNRYGLLKECLDALLNQTYKTDILIVDNASTDGTDKRLKKDGYLDKKEIIYLRLDKNMGGAGGFYEGMKSALQKDYDYIWLMDDDAEPETDALEILMNNLDDKYSGYAPAIFAGTKDNHIINIAGHRGYLDFEHPLPMIQKPISPELYNRKKVEIEMASFVGLLVKADLIRKTGLPKKEFFIHYDDTEFCIRLNKYGKILMLSDSKIYHKDKRQEEKYQKQFLWIKKNRIRFDKLWIKYFGVRNSIYLAKTYSTNTSWIFTMLKNYLLLVKDIIIFDDNKLIRIKFATSSYIDGLMGVFDNEKPRRILNGKI
jgi:rhamnopyranosyl-N-acetylglucosaminyl-diphospho-decaprenol beta-1,3/1,4-galactofuranosyltransferase